MFDNANVGGDTMADVISHLFHLPAAVRGDRDATRRLPAEVIDLGGVGAAGWRSISRLWSDVADVVRLRRGASPRLGRPQCRLGPGAGGLAYRQGRPPNGVYLGLITQRPPNSTPHLYGATRCSRCALTNATGAAPFRGLRRRGEPAVVCSSLGTREVLAFGEGVALPTRLRFKEVPVHQIAAWRSLISTVSSAASGHDLHFVRRRARPLARCDRSTATQLPTFMDGRPVESPMLQPSMKSPIRTASRSSKPLR